VSERLRVNWIACEAHGLCAELFPEHIALDDWGYPVIADRPVAPELLDHARRAIDACPTLALRLERVGREAAGRSREASGRSPRRGV